MLARVHRYKIARILVGAFLLLGALGCEQQRKERTMAAPQFDSDGWDRGTYAPFQLADARGRPSHIPGTPDFHLMFHDWEWLFANYAADLRDGAIAGYYMNGPGVEGLVKAVIFMDGRDPNHPGIFYNSEGDTCLVQFVALDEAAHVANLAAGMIEDRDRLLGAIAVARDQGFEDG